MSRNPLVCTYCGNRTFVEAGEEPRCLICAKRYVPGPKERPRFARPDDLRPDHHMEIVQLEEDIWRFYTRPDLGIRHYAYFIQRPGGNVLMDMQPLLTEDLAGWIEERGGIRHIILSHPHYYGAMDEFSARFRAPIHVHVSDRPWPAGYPNVEFFETERLSLDGALEVHRIPAQFEGGLCLLFARRRGVLFTGDTLMVSPATGELSAWKSTPRRVPYTREEFRVIREGILRLEFDQIFASVRGEVRSGAKERAAAFCADYLEETAVADREEQRRLLEEDREVPEWEFFRR
ncbi:MAG: MBL fold metallo-hydrolase [Candidatus Tectomicrobia bacterium]|nr:MBL fold metallo-hydrolase [Candidatus Tectomicrobia bacterium]